jgi:hypothetical protein
MKYIAPAALLLVALAVPEAQSLPHHADLIPSALTT